MNSRILALDYGRARIGLALSDPMKILAKTHKILSVDAKKAINVFLEELKLLQEQNVEIEKIVVGVPLKMSGEKSAMTEEVEAFIESLKEKTPIPIVAWDERLSSVQAEKALREAGLSRKKRTNHLDSLSAVLILQSFLETQSDI